MTGPLVSVVVPCFNSAATISRTLESILAQGYPALDVIVVDDASSDDSCRMVEAYADRGVRLIRQHRNLGASAARNAGIGAAKGDYIAFLDADDTWTPGKIDKQIALIEANPRMTFVVCKFAYIALDGTTSETLPRTGEIPAPADAWKKFLETPWIGTGCVLARTESVRSADGFDPRLRVAEDQDLWIKLALMGEVGCVPECLAYFHHSPASLMKQCIDGEFLYLLPTIQKHLRAQRHRLTKREVARILGRRFTNIGRNDIGSGRNWRGIKHLSRAVSLGSRPLENCLQIILASIPSRSIPIRRSRATAAPSEANDGGP